MKSVVALLLAVLSLSTLASDQVSIATYNVENLFDAEHDEGKNDYPYLPMNHPDKIQGCKDNNSGYYLEQCLKQDWNQDLVELKLNQIEENLLALPTKPQILALVEVENHNVLKMLAQKLGYTKVINTTSPDNRGIDVALLFNESDSLKFVGWQTHNLKGEYFLQKPTRDILEATFEYSNHRFALFVNHWPSQSNPDSTRIIAAKKVVKAIKDSYRKNKVQSVIVTGDFNTVDDDIQNGIKEYLLRPIKSGMLFFRNEVNLLDVDQEFMNDERIPYDLKKAKPLGTYFYAKLMQWNMLDRFFISSDLLNPDSKVQVDLKSYKIHQTDFNSKDLTYNDPNHVLFGTTIKGVPLRYNHHASRAEQAGYSDHYAIYMELKLNK